MKLPCELRTRYNNAKEFFFKNWDNPAYCKRALEEYIKSIDNLEYYNKTQRDSEHETELNIGDLGLLRVINKREDNGEW